MTDDPNFYHASASHTWPSRPMSVTGFAFDPIAGTVDFTSVPGFDLSRLIYIRHVKSGTFLYARPIERLLDLAAVDGVTVPTHPTSGKLLKLKASTASMAASDEILAVYDLPTAA